MIAALLIAAGARPVLRWYEAPGSEPELRAWILPGGARVEHRDAIAWLRGQTNLMVSEVEP